MVMSSGNHRNRTELRKHPRRQFHYSATIATEANAPTTSCVIINISHSGARLVLKKGEELPDRFVLLLSNKGGAHRRCRVIWRNETTLGVEFSDE
jgi:PilZ domain